MELYMEQIYNLFTLIITPLFNTTVFFLVLKRKKSLTFTLSLFAGCFLFVFLITRASFYNDFPLLYLILAIPLIVCVFLCFEGGFWQKYFAVLCVINVSVLTGYIVSPIAQAISPYGSSSFFLWQIILMFALYAAVLILTYKFLHGFFQKLFEVRGRIWILFTAGAIVSRLILRLCVPEGTYIAVNSLPQVLTDEIYDYYLVLFASAWCFIAVILAIVFTRRRIIDRAEIQNSKTALEAAKEHYAELSDSLETAAALRHDIKYQLNAISELAGKKDLDGIAKLLAQTENTIDQPLRFCGNAIADAILSWYAKRMKSDGITFTAEVDIPEDIPVESADLCVLLGNLLENARRAAFESENAAFVSIKAKTQPNMFVLEIENNFSGELQKKDGKLISTKENGGRGLKSIGLICEKYNGELITKFTEDKFTALILLNR
jgi:sensor histidine kinase YesM